MLTKQHLSTNLPQRAIRISLAVRVVLAKVCCFLHWKRISVERKSFLKDLPLSSSKQNGTNTLYCILTLMPRITLK